MGTNTALHTLNTLQINTQNPAESQARAAALARREAWPYPWIHMPADGRPWSRRGAVESPAYGSGNQVIVTGAVFEVPQGYRGVIHHLWWEFVGSGFVNGSGNVVVTVDVNTPLGSSTVAGYGLPDYANMVVQIGNAQYPWPVDGGWVLDEGDTVRVKVYTVATVGTGAPNYVLGGIQGWVWPGQGRR